MYITNTIVYSKVSLTDSDFIFAIETFDSEMESVCRACVVRHLAPHSRLRRRSDLVGHHP